MSRCKYGFCVIALLLAFHSSQAQSPAPSQPAAQSQAGGRVSQEAAPTTFRTSTELVLVPVLVRNSKGAHVSGLTREDFLLRQDGKAHDVTVFEELKTGEKGPSAAPLPPNTFTNLVESKTPQRLLIIVLDCLNTTPSEQVRMSKQLVAWLAKGVDAGVSISLLAVGRGGQVVILHDFTKDTNGLVEAARKLVGNQSTSPLTFPDMKMALAAIAEVGGTASHVNELNKEALVMLQSAEMSNNTLDTLWALRQVALSFSGVPGRKSLVWLSGGFPLSVLVADGFPTPIRNADFASLKSDYEKTWNAFNQANVAIYPLDAVGLHNADLDLDRLVPNIKYHAELNQADAYEHQRTDTVTIFAERTGGQALLRNNDLKVGLQMALDDSSSYYLLGFHPARNLSPGWHRIQVQVKRSGTRVRARNAFFVPKQAPTEAERRATDLRQALASPIDFTALPMTVQWTGFLNDGSEKRSISFRLGLLSDGLVKNIGDDSRMSLEVFVAAMTPTGKLAAEFVQKFEGELVAGAADKAAEKPVEVMGSFSLPPGNYNVRIACRNNVNGRLGSINAPLKVK